MLSDIDLRSELEIRPASSDADRAAWDALAGGPDAGHLQQCSWWTQPLESCGVRSSVIGVWERRRLVGGGLFRSVPVPYTGASVTQCLWGPLLPRWRPEWAEGLVREIDRLASEHGSLEVSLHGCASPRAHEDLRAAFQARGLDPALAPGSVDAVVPLEGASLEELRRRMSEGTRRNIRKGQASGARIALLTDAGGLRRAHEAWLATASRKGFSEVRPWPYLGPAVERCVRERRGAVLASLKDDRLLAAVFVSLVGGRGVYVYGGYMDGAEPYAPNHVLHLEAMKLCLERGLREYDLGRLPGEPGLDRFKLGFGAQRRPQLDTIVWRRRPLLSAGAAWLKRQSLGKAFAGLLRRRLLAAPAA